MATNTKPGKPSTTLDFTKVFSENSPIQPFTWTLSEYLKGWAAIEMTPPARQQFDALQAHSDRKENWLYNQYLEGYVDKFLDYLDTIKAPLHSPKFTGTPTTNGVPIGYGVGDHSYDPWYFWIGDYYVVQYSGSTTDADGIAKLQLPVSVATDSSGTGIMVACPGVYTNDLKAYSFAIGHNYPYRTADEVWVTVRDGETGEPAEGVIVGALCWCVPA